MASRTDTSTLSLHDALPISEVGQTPLLTVISILFLIVFSLKAGLLLYQWLPGSYSAPPTAVAALFGALLTKVGVYALRSEEHTSELQSRGQLVCRLLLEKKK